ncbi:hypothetical protein SCUP515_05207 [Seiridium cupressi]
MSLPGYGPLRQPVPLPDLEDWHITARSTGHSDNDVAHTSGPFTDHGERNWNIALVMLAIILIGMGWLVAVDIWRKCKTGEFQEGMKDLGHSVLSMIKATGRGVIALPGAIIFAPRALYRWVAAKSQQRKQKAAHNALLDAAKAESGQAGIENDGGNSQMSEKALGKQPMRKLGVVPDPHAASHFATAPLTAIPSHQALPKRMMHHFA